MVMRIPGLLGRLALALVLTLAPVVRAEAVPSTKSATKAGSVASGDWTSLGTTADGLFSVSAKLEPLNRGGAWVLVKRSLTSKPSAARDAVIAAAVEEAVAWDRTPILEAEPSRALSPREQAQMRELLEDAKRRQAERDTARREEYARYFSQIAYWIDPHEWDVPAKRYRLVRRDAYTAGGGNVLDASRWMDGDWVPVGRQPHETAEFHFARKNQGNGARPAK